MNEEPIWSDFVKRWRELRIESLNEQGIREEFVAPLLRTLGYSGGTIAGVLYEQSEPLPPAFRNERQPSMRPDYILTYRLERFWVMEVKRPGSLDRETFTQAQFYAVHPRVRARYIVITDGVEIRIYDAWAETYEEPRAVVDRESADKTFGNLHEVLAAKNLLAVIRRDVLADVERALTAELDERAPDEILGAIHGIVQRSRPRIRENVRQLVVEAHRKEQDQREESLRAMDLRGLLWTFEQPTHIFANRSNEVYRRIAEAEPADRACIALQVLSLGDSLCRITTRYHVLRVLLLAAESGLDDLPFDALAEGTRFARENLEYRSGNALACAALHLENACNRVAMKTVALGMTHAATTWAERTTKTMALEDRLVSPPNAVVPMLASASNLAVRLRETLLCNDVATVVRRLRSLERIERECLAGAMPKRPGDQLLLDHHGQGFDLLIRATQDALSQTVARRPGLLPDDLAVAGYEFNSRTVRPTPPTPAGDDEDEQLTAQLRAGLSKTLGVS